ncbi:MAG: site-specific integrase [Burkholderiales bacterium]|nr:site-specific integrase [Burkholderiales bacterium]
MARTIRNARLENRTQRLSLSRERFHWFRLGEGVALGYRRTKAGFGTWTVRVLTDPKAGRYATDRIGRADDYENADGREILTFDQATARARELVASAREKASGQLSAPLTVKKAAEDYLTWFRAHRKSATATETTLKAHVLPTFGTMMVADLTTREIARWHERLATSAARVRAPVAGSRRSRERDRAKAKASAPPAPAAPPAEAPASPEALRQRKSTANRVLTVFRAVLNHAWRAGHVPSDAAWRRVRPFHNASAPRVRYLEPDEATRLVNASPADFRKLVTAALLTGCRLGELVNLYVEDYHADARAIHVRDSKSGKPRHVPLTDNGEAFFTDLTAGRAKGETMLLRGDGTPWGKNHHVRPMAEACKVAKITPAVSFHILRHTYGSWLAMRGVALQVIAEALGHADTRITQRHYGHLAPSYVAQVIRANLPAIPIEAGNVTPLKPASPAKTTRKGSAP